MGYAKLLVTVLVIDHLTHVNSLNCYTCDGKKGQCDSSADPGQETNCPSVFSLIRPSVMIALGRILLYKISIHEGSWPR